MLQTEDLLTRFGECGGEVAYKWQPTWESWSQALSGHLIPRISFKREASTAPPTPSTHPTLPSKASMTMDSEQPTPSPQYPARKPGFSSAQNVP